MVGHRGQRRQEGNRIRATIDNGAKEFVAMLAHDQPFTKEDKVQFAPLSDLGKAHIGLEFGKLGMIRMTPGNAMPHTL